MKIKKLLKEIALTLVLAYALVNIIGYFKKPEFHFETIPTMAIPTIDGGEFNTEAVKGKPFIVHFWATWCPTCKLELESCNDMAKEYDIVTVAVQSGSDEELHTFMKERDLNFPVINDTNGILADKFSITGFPTTIIFNKESKVAFVEVGFLSKIGFMARMWWYGML